MATKRVSSGKGPLDAALALNKKEVVQLSFDPLAAKRACKRGLETIAEHRKTFAKSYPGINLAELDQLPDVCDLVLKAQRETQSLRTAGGDVGVAVKGALAWRRRLLGLAQSLSEENGPVDSRQLAKIVSGQGTTDNLQDVVDLVRLLGPSERVVEAAHGKGALAQAEAAAREALTLLGGTGGDTPASRSAADRRDRLATLVIQRHDRLRAAAAVVVGYRAAELAVPPLGGGPGPSRSVKEAPTTPSETKPDA